MYNTFTDPLFYLFIIALAVYTIVRMDRVINLLQNGVDMKEPVWDSDYINVMLLTLLSFYPIYSVFSMFGNQLIEIPLIGFKVFFTLPVLFTGIAYTLLFSQVWYQTIQSRNGVALVGLFPSLMFGAFFSTFLVTALHPSANAVTSVYGYYIDQAKTVLQFISVAAVIPVLEYTIQIFKNNLTVILRGSIFSVIGGIAGVAGLLAMIPLFGSAVTSGSVAGILLRNNLGVINSLISLLAVLGVPPFWHTFYEFLAFGAITSSVALVVYSAIYGKLRKWNTGLLGIVFGSVVLLVGALFEVAISSQFAGYFKGILNFTPTISPLAVNATYLATFISSVVVVSALIALIGIALETIVGSIKSIIR